MPKCVDCGVEKPREDMWGPNDDLRCDQCVKKTRKVYQPPAQPVARTSDAYVTITLIGLAVLVFITQNGQIPLTRWLTDDYFSMARGEVWRLVTTILPHGGVFHLFFNLWWVWTLGPTIESWMGVPRYLGFVLLAAVVSMGSQFLFNGPAIGLSGVVYAYFGLLLAVRRHKDFAAVLLTPNVIQWMAISFFLGILLTETQTLGVGNVAHFGGAVLGFAVGWATVRKQRHWAIYALAIGGVVLAIACWRIAAHQFGGFVIPAVL